MLKTTILTAFAVAVSLSAMTVAQADTYDRMMHLRIQRHMMHEHMEHRMMKRHMEHRMMHHMS